RSVQRPRRYPFTMFTLERIPSLVLTFDQRMQEVPVTILSRARAMSVGKHCAGAVKPVRRYQSSAGEILPVRGEAPEHRIQCLPRGSGIDNHGGIVVSRRDKEDAAIFTLEHEGHVHNPRLVSTLVPRPWPGVGIRDAIPVAGQDI